MFPVFASGQQYDTLFVNKDIQLVRFYNSFYIHISWDESEEYGRFSSNGLVLIHDSKALMIDTPTDEEKTEALYNYIQDSLHAKVIMFIPTHWHNDCIGGLSFLHRKGVHSIANELTINECIKRDLPVPQSPFLDSAHITFKGIQLVGYYPGPGHSLDNIVVYFPYQKILFGGCLIKSQESSGIGNIVDADVLQWPESLENVKSRFGHARFVIPGHGSMGSVELIGHTISIVNYYLRNKE
ncbi:Metallo-beta-lactamase type 2 [anaerobic digester metagenome]